MNDVHHGWEIGLDAWIIQDGNYGDFATGQVVEFALEFYSKDYRQTEPRAKSCAKLGAAKYSVVGEVIYLNDEAWILDFGMCAFQESKPPIQASVGGFIAAEIYLGIDPFFYFERLHTSPKIPPLICTWKINSIWRQTTPLVELHEPSNRKAFVRDKNKLAYSVIPKTDAWKDDGGHGEYFLTCELLPVPPKFNRATAASS
jgi:hypothetical protein